MGGGGARRVIRADRRWRRGVDLLGLVMAAGGEDKAEKAAERREPPHRIVQSLSHTYTHPCPRVALPRVKTLPSSSSIRGCRGEGQRRRFVLCLIDNGQQQLGRILHPRE